MKEPCELADETRAIGDRSDLEGGSQRCPSARHRYVFGNDRRGGEGNKMCLDCRYNRGDQEGTL